MPTCFLLTKVEWATKFYQHLNCVIQQLSLRDIQNGMCVQIEINMDRCAQQIYISSVSYKKARSGVSMAR